MWSQPSRQFQVLAPVSCRMAVVGHRDDSKKAGLQVLQFERPSGPMPRSVKTMRWVLLVTGILSFVSLAPVLSNVLQFSDELGGLTASFGQGLGSGVPSACELNPAGGAPYCPIENPEAAGSGVVNPATDCITAADGSLARNDANEAYCIGAAPPASALTDSKLHDIATVVGNLTLLVALIALAAMVAIPVRLIRGWVRMPRGEPWVLTGIRKAARTQLVLQLGIAFTMAFIFAGVEGDLARFSSAGNGLTVLAAAFVLWLARKPQVREFFTDHRWEAVGPGSTPVASLSGSQPQRSPATPAAGPMVTLSERAPPSPPAAGRPIDGSEVVIVRGQLPSGKRLICPKCGTPAVVAPGARPACGTCGFGT